MSNSKLFPSMSYSSCFIDGENKIIKKPLDCLTLTHAFEILLNFILCASLWIVHQLPVSKISKNIQKSIHILISQLLYLVLKIFIN